MPEKGCVRKTTKYRNETGALLFRLLYTFGKTRELFSFFFPQVRRHWCPFASLYSELKNFDSR